MSEVRANRTAQDLRITVTARQHSLIADADLRDGGTDLGPTPHEILAGSLAACTSMTVQMYANRKQWPLKSADATVFLSEAASKESEAATVFNVTVSLQGDLTTEQRSRLLEIAKRCPVHRVLVGSISVNVSLV